MSKPKTDNGTLLKSTVLFCLRIKVGRHEYDITTNDKFMDNGACVQLITQAKQHGDWGHKITPKLSGRAIKEISTFHKVHHPCQYKGCEVFSLQNAKISHEAERK